MDEAARLASLRELAILGRPPMPRLEPWVRLAARLCRAPMAALALIDATHVRFHVQVGCTARDQLRAGSLWDRALGSADEVLVVVDGGTDPTPPRAALAAAAPDVRAFMAAPLVTDEGHAIGVLAVMAPTPTRPTAAAQHTLRALARQMMTEIALAAVDPAAADATPTRAEQRLQQLLTGDQEWTWFELDQADAIASWTRAAEHMTGYAAAEVLGQPLARLLPGDSAPGRLHPGDGHGGQRAWLRHKDGSLFVAHLAVTPGEGGAGRQVALRSAAPRGLGDDRLRTAVEASPSAMLMVDEEGRLVMVNGHTERLFGWHRSELLGQPVEVLVPERFRATHPAQRAGFFADPVTRPMGAGRDLTGLRRDGSEVPIEIGLSPIRTPAGVWVLASIVDLTERKRAEMTMRASLAEKETLLKEIHHRVKNNIQVISSLLQLQARSISDPGLLATFRESQDRLRTMGLIHEQLYQAGDLAHIDFAAYARTLVNLLRSSYARAASGARVELDLDPVRLDMDTAVPLGLIVHELVSNCFKHAYPGGRAGLIRIALRETPDQNCTLTVRDDGVGAPTHVDLRNSASLGLRLVRILAGQLQAQVEFHTGDTGVAATVQFHPKGTRT